MIDAAICFHAICPEFAPPIYPGGCVIFRSCGWEFYREATDGQILEEGITEAGSMASFIAAGTSYSQHGISMIPFFIYYSMFGFQRI